VIADIEGMLTLAGMDHQITKNIVKTAVVQVVRVGGHIENLVTFVAINRRGSGCGTLDIEDVVGRTQQNVQCLHAIEIDAVGPFGQVVAADKIL